MTELIEASRRGATAAFARIIEGPQQLEAACEMGNWPVELRRCFSTADSVMTLQGCVMPEAGHY